MNSYRIYNKNIKTMCKIFISGHPGTAFIHRAAAAALHEEVRPEAQYSTELLAFFGLLLLLLSLPSFPASLILTATTLFDTKAQ